MTTTLIDCGGVGIVVAGCPESVRDALADEFFHVDGCAVLRFEHLPEVPVHVQVSEVVEVREATEREAEEFRRLIGRLG